MGTIELALTHGQVALIDSADIGRVSLYRWAALSTGGKWYAYVGTSGGNVYLHRLITDAPKGREVDHINGDPLDNRRSNLRIATHRQNISNQALSRANTSGYKGVVVIKEGVWAAQLKQRPHMYHLGRFTDLRTAAYAYDLKAVELFGEFASCNLLTVSDDHGAIALQVAQARLPGRSGVRLTEQHVRDIRAKYASGMRVSDLSREYGAAHGTIGPIVHGKAWKHVA